MPLGVINRRKGAETRPRFRVQHAVRVEDEPADVRLLQKLFDPLHVGAFRQPDAARVAPETTAVMVARGQNLRAEGRRMVRQQRQQSVRGGGGDDFNPAFVLELLEGVDQIAAAGAPGVADLAETVMIHPGEFVERAVPVGAVDFLFRQFDQAVQMPLVAVAQQRVEQHRTQRRREREASAARPCRRAASRRGFAAAGCRFR